MSITTANILARLDRLERHAGLAPLDEPAVEAGPKVHTITLARGKPHAPIVLDRPARVVAGGAGDDPPTVRLAGNGVCVEVRSPGCSLDGLRFDGGLDPSARPGRQHRRGVVPADGTVITGCDFTGLDSGVVIEGNQKGVVIDGCGFGVLAGYGVWLGGRDLRIADCTFAGSLWEHSIRGTGDGVTVAGNRFTSAGDKRSDLWAMGGSRWVVEGNRFDGSAGVGPLSRGDGLATKDARITDVVWRNNVYGPDASMTIGHGTERLTVKDNRLTEVTLEGRIPEYDRPLLDVTLRRNTIVYPRARGAVLWLAGGPTENLVIENNRVVAPRLEAGNHGGGALVVEPPAATSTIRSTGNVWPTLPRGWKPGQPMRIGNQNDNAAYYDPERWSALPWVEGDTFRDLTEEEVAE